MPNEIKARQVKHKFACGKDFTNLTVVNFVGPGELKLSAYCCNMNVDVDGDPQAYAPLENLNLQPKDNLHDGGWKTPAENAKLKLAYEAGKQALAELEKKRAASAAATANPASPTPAPVAKNAAPDPAMAALDKQIKEKKEDLVKRSFEHQDPEGNHAKNNPKNFETIFWKWYGVVSMTPEERDRAHYLEMGARTFISRKPVLDTTSHYEDVFGRFPVVQSVFEPGTDYFVSQVPHAANTRFPHWDQRYFLPPGETGLGPFGALAAPLAHVTGLQLKDTVFAVRLDTTDTLEFPFRDSGKYYKVAECSLEAFVGLGGNYIPANVGAAKFPNNFLVLYLAFPNRQKPADVLAQFATASNAADFPVMLSFIAQVTQEAKARHSQFVGGDPLAVYEKWKKLGSTTKPDSYETIVQGLRGAGSDFVERMLKRHSLLDNGPYLRPPTQP